MQGKRDGPAIAVASTVKPSQVMPIAALFWAMASPAQTAPRPAASIPIAPANATDQSQSVALPDAPVSAALKPLTLEGAVALAEQNSPRLRGAAAASQRAASAVRTSRAYTNPSIEVFQGVQSARPIATPGVPGLLQHYAAYQTIEIPSERRARTRVAELIRTSAGFGQQGVTRSVVADVKHAFFSVLRQREEVEHQQENLQLVEDLRRRAEVEYRVGEKGRLELTRAEAELGRAGFAVRGAQLELANAIALLRIAIAAPADDTLDPQGALEPRIKLPELAVLREEVLRTHPAIAQATADVDTAAAKLARERSLRIPQPTAFAEFENQPDLRFWRAGVTVPIPLWDRRGGQIDESKAAIAQARAEADQRRLELISATERAYEQYQLADQQATSIEAGDLRAASSAVDAAQAAYRFGERGIVEVLDAQRVLQGVRDDLLNAQFARQSALIDLEELGAIVPGGRP
jgi:cobalt-zinc-cadmium efflux system outer membrane protein